MKRGDLYRVRHLRHDPKPSRVVVVVSRPGFIAAPFSSVVCAPVHSARHGAETEVHVGADEGLKHDSSILCDALASVPKAQLTDYVGTLGPGKLAQLKVALRIALAID
jgi:mRNA interferase MazF